MTRVQWAALTVPGGAAVDVVADDNSTTPVLSIESPSDIPAGGGGALEDPGNAWAADTALALGYRIGVTNGAYTEVFEVELAGTTGEANGQPQFFPTDPNDWQTYWQIPGGKTFDNTVEWRHLGRVGEPPVASTGDALPIIEVNGDDGQTIVRGGSVRINIAQPYAGAFGKPLSIHRYTAASTTELVVEIDQTGDADWYLRSGAAFAFQQGGSKQVNINEDRFRVQGSAAGTVLEASSDGNVYMNTLPTADPGPGFAGALWVDVAAGRVIKVSAG